MLASLPAGPLTSPDAHPPSAWCPCCEMCCTNDAILFCRNDKAFLCAPCNYKIHQNNPLACRHEVVAVGDHLSAEVRLANRHRHPKRF